MWTDYYLRAESEEVFLAAVPEGWKDESGVVVGAADAAVDVVGPVGEWFLVNLRLTGALPSAFDGMAIGVPAFPRRVFA